MATEATEKSGSTSLGEHRYVFLLRHGKSRWNEAQESYSLYGMYTENDHPLCREGVRQAERLRLDAEARRHAISNDKVQFPETEQLYLTKFLAPSIIMVSPFTRAVQTACVGLRELFPQSTGGLKIAKEAREQKNFGGADCSGVAVGSKIKERAVSELKPLYRHDDAAEASLFEAMQKATDSAKWDFSGVEDEWWHSVMEFEDDIEKRLDTLLDDIRSIPSGSSAVVVSHSQLIRRFFRRYCSADLKKSSPDTVAALSTSLIPCCGMIGCRIDWDGQSGLPQLSECIPMLGTKIQIPGHDDTLSYLGAAVLGGCCSGRRRGEPQTLGEMRLEPWQLDLPPPPN